jgi:hypothetical protein
MDLCSDRESFKTAVFFFDVCGLLYCLSPLRAIGILRSVAELSLEIRYTEALTEEERQALFGWGKDIFGVEDRNYRWRPKDYHFITEEDGRPLSHVGIIKTVVSVGGRPPP